jgi:hypothetical protein
MYLSYSEQDFASDLHRILDGYYILLMEAAPLIKTASEDGLL